MSSESIKSPVDQIKKVESDAKSEGRLMYANPEAEEIFTRVSDEWQRLETLIQSNQEADLLFRDLADQIDSFKNIIDSIINLEGIKDAMQDPEVARIIEKMTSEKKMASEALLERKTKREALSREVQDVSARLNDLLQELRKFAVH
jgi:hypothetical protein